MRRGRRAERREGEQKGRAKGESKETIIVNHSLCASSQTTTITLDYTTLQSRILNLRLHTTHNGVLLTVMTHSVFKH